MDDYTYLSALDALVDSRPMLDPANYGDLASYRHDQRRNARNAADYRLLRLYVKPTNEELREAARGSRITFDDNYSAIVDYCAGQYYPVEYRRAAVRLIASAWWQAVAGRLAESDADTIRAQARRTFGRGIARRYFN